MNNSKYDCREVERESETITVQEQSHLINSGEKKMKIK